LDAAREPGIHNPDRGKLVPTVVMESGGPLARLPE
jgi:hypothetical protein